MNRYDGPIRPSTSPLRKGMRQAILRLAGGLGNRKGAAGGAPRSILLIRPDHLGDLLFMTPALHALRECLPGVRLDLLAGPWGAAAVAGNRDLDTVRECPFPGFERRPKTSAWAPYRQLLATAAELHPTGYDAAVILRFDHWWGAWLAQLAGIPQRIGYDLPETRPFLTAALPYTAGRHEVEQNASLLAALAPGLETGLGETRFTWSDEDRSWVDGWLAAHGLSATQRLAAIHPGSGAAVKGWPHDAWSAVAVRLAGAGLAPVLTGSAAERLLTDAIASGAGIEFANAAGETTLGRLAALYSRCAVVLGSDSGPLHLAVAAGASTVHLYGPIDPARFGPWGDPRRHVVLRSDWECAPCDRLDWPAQELGRHGCMAAIQPEAVTAAALRLAAR